MKSINRQEKLYLEQDDRFQLTPKERILIQEKRKKVDYDKIIDKFVNKNYIKDYRPNNK